MAIISSVLKLVNVGGAVNSDEGKDKQEEKAMFSSDSEEVSFSRKHQVNICRFLSISYTR
jgi:hypothetical protein